MLKSITILFFPLLSEIKYDDLFFMKGPNFLESSPLGFSTLIISAPRSDNICVAKGPESTFVKSSTTILLRGRFLFT